MVGKKSCTGNANCQPIHHRYLTDTPPTVHQYISDTLLILSSPTCWMICQPIFDRYSTDNKMSLDWYNDWLSKDTWPTLERYSDGYVDSQSTEMLADTLVDTPSKTWSTQSRICNLGQSAPPQNQGWENGMFWLLHSFILDLGGWGFAVPLYSV